MNTKRYKAENNWTVVDDYDWHTWDGDTAATVTVEVADLTDKRTGDRYSNGARKATVKVVGRGMRTKMFCGEMAYHECVSWLNQVESEVVR
jgi:hypothetical protein